MLDTYRLNIHVKAALTQSILQKTLNIRITDFEAVKKDDKDTTKKDEKKDRVQPAAGKINNLMSMDVAQLIDARYGNALNNDLMSSPNQSPSQII